MTSATLDARPSTSYFEDDMTKAYTVQKLKDKMQQIFRRRTQRRQPMTAVIETDFLQPEQNGHKGSTLCGTALADTTSHSTCSSSQYDRVSGSSSYGTFEDDEILEEDKCREVSKQLRQHLHASREAHLRCDLLLPSDLIERISRDVVRMSQCEPCGLGGCVLFLQLEKQQISHKISKVTFDPNTLATFELTLTLMEDKKQWFSWRTFIKPVVWRCFTDSWNEQVFVSPGYRLVKKKLYREH